MAKKIGALILSVVSVLIMGIVTAYGESSVTNVSTNCNVTTYKAGDEVRLQVSTKEMSICTFIAYVEYNGDELEYVGYEGGVSKKYVALEVKDSESNYFEVAVEQAESRSLIGMYAVGTKEKTYAAAAPLVTLIFKAKNSGTVSEETFVMAETSDGADGFTSESISQASGQEDSGEAESKSTDSESNLSNISADDGTSIWIISIAAVVIILLIILFIMKKNRRK